MSFSQIFNQSGQTVGTQINLGDDMPKGGNTVTTTKLWVDAAEGVATKYIGLYPKIKLDWLGKDEDIQDAVAKLGAGMSIYVPSTAMERLVKAWDAMMDADVVEEPTEMEQLADTVGFILDSVATQTSVLSGLVNEVKRLSKVVASLSEPQLPAAGSLDERNEEDVLVYKMWKEGDVYRYEQAPMVPRHSAVTGSTSREAIDAAVASMDEGKHIFVERDPSVMTKFMDLLASR